MAPTGGQPGRQTYCHQDGAWRFERQHEHELFYGAPPATPPNNLPPANWPERDTGRGTFPPGAPDGRGPEE